MKGFNIAEGYIGWIGDRYMLFTSEQDYKEFMKETWYEILDLVHREYWKRLHGYIYNSGDCNTGHCNTGIYNSGDWNSGDCNSGDWNKASNSVGCFNTEDRPLFFFDKPTDITFEQWRSSDAYWIRKMF